MAGETSQKMLRLSRELKQLQSDPPFGVCCWLDEDRVDTFQAQIAGPAGTPYEDGLFRVELTVPPRYPFEPPGARFVTPIYHPNIDTGGRICLDVLKMPPKGAWKPSLNLSTILASIQQLLTEPNPDDALMAEIANEFRHRRAEFDRTARAKTMELAATAAAPSASGPVPASTVLDTGSLTPAAQAHDDAAGSAGARAAATAAAVFHGDAPLVSEADEGAREAKLKRPAAALAPPSAPAPAGSLALKLSRRREAAATPAPAPDAGAADDAR